jgi:16S rRNA (guanine527-N7)-methyltransferase
VRASPTAEQAESIARFLDELSRWNRRINLTSVDPDDAWRRHVDESLRLLERADPAPGSTIVDVGSGAGLPGVVVAIVRPDLRVALLESDARKQAFLTHVAGLLALRGVSVVAARAEVAGHQSGLRESFDAALSRAAAPPPTLCELALPLLRVGGRLCALVADTRAAAAASEVAARLCGGDRPRAADGVLVIDKIAPTPPAYPRRPGVPSRRPLG